MEKIVSIVVILFMIFMTTGCNKQIFDLNYTYKKAVCNYNGDAFVLDIEKWNDYDGEQLQVKSEGITYLLSANNCYLIGD